MEKITKNKNGQWNIEKIELNLDKEIEEGKAGKPTEDYPLTTSESNVVARQDRKKIKQPQQPQFKVAQPKVPLTKNDTEDMEKGIKSTLAAAGLAAAGLAANTAHADVDPHTDLHNRLSAMNVMGEYHVGGKSGSVVKEPGQFKASPEHPSSTFNIEHTDKNKTATGNFFGPDAEKAKAALHNFYNTHINKTPNMMVKSELDEKLEQLEKALDDLKAASKEKEMFGVKNGVVGPGPAMTGKPKHYQMGTTESGKPIMSTHGRDEANAYHSAFTPEEHKQAYFMHANKAKELSASNMKQHVHPDLPAHHSEMSKFHWDSYIKSK
jgi:hypothetical protein